MTFSAFETFDYLNDPEVYSKEQELKGMNLAIEAVLTLARRYSEYAAELAKKEYNSGTPERTETISAVCKHVPA